MQTPNAKLLTHYEHPAAILTVARDDESNRIYAGGMDGAICVLQGEGEASKLERLAVPHANYLSSLTIVKGIVISGGYDRDLVWTDLSNGEILRRVSAHAGWVRDVVSFAEGTRIASVGDDMKLCLWDAETGELIQAMEGHPKQTPEGYATALYAVAASSDGKFLATGDRIGEVRVWDAKTGKLLESFRAKEFYTYDPTKRIRSIGGIRSLAFSGDGSKLAIAGIGQVTNVDGFVGPCRVEVWDWQNKKRTLAGQDKHKAVLNHVAFHPKSPWLIAAGGGDSGGILAVWDFEKTEPIHKAKPKGHLHEFCFDPEGDKLYAAGYDGIQVWSLVQ